MSNAVVVLGAGASVSSGLKSLQSLFDDPDVQGYVQGACIELTSFIRDCINVPRGVDGSFPRDLNLEEILTLISQWRRCLSEEPARPWVPRLPSKYHDVNLLDTIIRQIHGCVYHAVYVNKSGRNGSHDYNTLIEILDKEFDHITWATFNWDAMFEQAFFYTFLQGKRLPSIVGDILDYDDAGRLNEKHTLLKLHGSVTWFKESDSSIRYKRFGKTQSRNEVRPAWEAYLDGDGTCGEPLIAEPTFFKHESLLKSTFLMEQWRRFESSLLDADKVIIIGYSLPDGDATSKQLLLSVVANACKAQFVVVDPEDVVCVRYERLLGLARVKAFRKKFGPFLAEQGSELTSD
ncbi:MAG: hypothetical protein O9258_07825 [Fimbriimonadaceae bacterium]|jgi:NAD-dependent SIR2 family protein deacetylase|nr:hypothetical protein [Fimbriimonadaceae bacterium]